MDSGSSSIKGVPVTATVVVAELPGRPDQVTQGKASKPRKQKRGTGFWLIFLAICVSIMLSALDLAAVPTALPSIVADLDGESSFAWVGSAYTLAAAAWLPLSGALATAFGRQPIMLSALVLFFIGSILCGEAVNMNMLIAGRAVQGLGSGGIIALSEIIIADLIPLKERGLFMGLTSLVWAFASAIGPPVAGGFAENVSWRWIFRINLPIAFAAFCLVAVFLKLKVPSGNIKQKLRRIDWLGNALIAASTCAVTIALTRGGVEVSWTSAETLVPLILGLIGTIGFFVYESMWVAEPTIPFDLLSNRTSVAGYLTTFFQSIIATAVIFYIPVYFQACLGASPIRAGIDTFGLAFTIAPAALVGGVSAVLLKRYVPQNWIGWTWLCVAMGVLSLLRADTPTAKWVGFQIFLGIPLGILYATVKFPILSPLPVSRNASAMSLFTFSRTFAQTFGISIGSAVLQNELKSRLPAGFLALFPGGVDVSFAAIPYIPTLPEPVRTQVREAFAASLSTLWKVMLAVCFLGLISALLMKEIELHGNTDENWDLSEEDDASEQGAKGDIKMLPVLPVTSGQTTAAPSLDFDIEKGVLVIGPPSPYEEQKSAI